MFRTISFALFLALASTISAFAADAPMVAINAMDYNCADIQDLLQKNGTIRVIGHGLFGTTSTVHHADSNSCNRYKREIANRYVRPARDTMWCTVGFVCTKRNPGGRRH